jgi:hypothetical protein
VKPAYSQVPPAASAGGELAGRRDRSGLAPDVDLVGLEDQVGAALPMAQQYRDERGAKVSDGVNVLRAFRSLQPG